MENKYLVVVRAGDASLHPEWLAGSRNWDIVVSYYGDNPDRYRENGIPRFDQKGTKWQGLYHLFSSGKIDWRSYDYVWLPDDDLRTNAQNINGIFTNSKRLGARLSQPALDWESYYSHLITIQHKSILFRQTNFVEIMAPCFRTDFLEKALPTFNENVSGWGIEFLWQRLLETGNPFYSFILDSNSITHTRPIGSAGSGMGENNVMPHNELSALIAKHGIKSTIHLTLCGVTVSNQHFDIAQSREILIGHLFMALQEKFGSNVNFNQYMLNHARVSVHSRQFP